MVRRPIIFGNINVGDVSERPRVMDVEVDICAYRVNIYSGNFSSL